MKTIPIFLYTLFISIGWIACGEKTEVFEADVVIYGGTSAGIMAAVEVVRQGKKVVLVAPEKHLGGLSSGGLGYTDTGNKEVIGGLARTFYQKLYGHYQDPANWKWQPRDSFGNQGQGTVALDGEKRTMWIFEPHAAERAFEELIKEHHVKIWREEWLDRSTSGVTKEGTRVLEFRTLSDKLFRGKMFIDATYEGDLMAAAGISYRVGRESNSTFGEQWNGVQKGAFHHRHHFMENISPYLVPGDPESGVLPRISTEHPGENGQGDHRLQAYCFRMCLSDHPENRIPFLRPSRYDSTQYVLLSRIFETGWNEVFHKFDRIPNRKTDTNNHGPFSTDNIGMNYDYPEADYERRREIIEEHKNYQMGLMYFLSHDPSVPSDVRNEMAKWGLAADEFTDNDYWPYQIYVREARRMNGTFTMTEHEILGRRTVGKPVGMGSYTMDSHHVQRYITEEGFVQNEGDIGIKPDRPYQIDYEALLPKKEESTNLLVPVCLSSSHIAYGSIRMEPVFMILGQSAAIAACLAMDQQIAVQDLSYPDLEKKLVEAGQVLKY